MRERSSSSWVRSTLRAAVTVSVAGAIVAAAPAPACTPAPCIVASPNPVTLPSGQTQGTTALDWSTGPTSGAGDLSIQVLSGGQLLQSFAVAAQGQQTIGVQAGTSYTARLVLTKGTRQMILASVQIPVTAGPRIRLPGPAQVSVIRDVRTIPRGTWVELQLVAPFPARVEVWISTTPPSGYSEQGLQVAAHIPPGGSPVTRHAPKLYDLAPARRYYYLVRATGDNGLRAHARGEFTTLRRFAKVSIDSIDVIDDSDDLSAGDLAFSFHLSGGGATTSLLGPGDGSGRTVEADSGETIGVGRVFELETTAEAVELDSTGFDDDQQPFVAEMFKAPPCRWDQPFTGSYSDDVCDRAGDARTFSGLGPRADGEETFKVADFQHNVLGETLKFRVHGRIWVYYR
ncbi:MAG: hypothetical protein R2991_09410 [Thermoanaerobaculia bacterium]